MASQVTRTCSPRGERRRPMHPATTGAPAAPVRYALTGACGGFARTLLAQTPLMERVRAGALCDLDTAGAVALCIELGYPAQALKVCATSAEVAALDAEDIAVVADTALLEDAAYDVLVEATGNPAVGTRAAQTALGTGRHVAMVSKEVDSVAGADLAAMAAE